MDTIVTKSAGNIFFSIVMPCYNSEKYIDRAIQSCLNQKFENWELIIINDGSTDNTLNIVEGYALQDERISVFSKENGGYVSAVNYGLNYINGIYFMLLGSDDEICQNLFLDVYQNIENGQLPDFIGFRTLINKNNKIKKDKYSDFTKVAQVFDTNIKDFSLAFPEQSKIFFTRDTSKFYKSELLGSLRYFGQKGMDADGIFSMMFSHKAKSFLCVPVDGYIWYLREDSLSGRKKDYITQVDRLENWMKFGEFTKTIEPSQVTAQEKHYLVKYVYNILRNIVFYYLFDCLKNGIIKRIKRYFNGIISFLLYEIENKEIRFFLNHTVWWTIFLLPKVLFEKISKKTKK